MTRRIKNPAAPAVSTDAGTSPTAIPVARVDASAPSYDDVIPTDLIDLTEAAKKAKCHVSALHRWRLKGKIRSWRRCGRWFVSEAELMGLFQPFKPKQPPGPRAKAVDRLFVENYLREKGLLVT